MKIFKWEIGGKKPQTSKPDQTTTPLSKGFGKKPVEPIVKKPKQTDEERNLLRYLADHLRWKNDYIEGLAKCERLKTESNADYQKRSEQLFRTESKILELEQTAQAGEIPETRIIDGLKSYLGIATNSPSELEGLALAQAEITRLKTTMAEKINPELDNIQKDSKNKETLAASALQRTASAYQDRSQGTRTSIIKLLEEDKSLVDYQIPAVAELREKNALGLDGVSGLSLIGFAIHTGDWELLDALAPKVAKKELRSEEIPTLIRQAEAHTLTVMRGDANGQDNKTGPIRRLTDRGFNLDTVVLPDGSEAYNLLERTYPLEYMADILGRLTNGLEIDDLLEHVNSDLNKCIIMANDGLYSPAVEALLDEAIATADLPESTAAIVGTLKRSLQTAKEALGPERSRALTEHARRLGPQTHTPQALFL